MLPLLFGENTVMLYVELLTKVQRYVIGIDDTPSAEYADYLQTPVFIHTRAKIHGITYTAFSFNFQNRPYRFQQVDDHMYGPFDEDMFRLLRNDYQTAGLLWVDL